MYKTKKVVAWLSIGFGVFFLAVTASDIQMGTGIILISNGLLNYPTK